MFGNVFAERLLLSLRKVDDPGTRAFISSLAFNITMENEQEGGQFDSLERTYSGHEGTTLQINDGWEEPSQRHNCIYEV